MYFERSLETLEKTQNSINLCIHGITGIICTVSEDAANALMSLKMVSQDHAVTFCTLSFDKVSRMCKQHMYMQSQSSTTQQCVVI